MYPDFWDTLYNIYRNLQRCELIKEMQSSVFTCLLYNSTCNFISIGISRLACKWFAKKMYKNHFNNHIPHTICYILLVSNNLFCNLQAISDVLFFLLQIQKVYFLYTNLRCNLEHNNLPYFKLKVIFLISSDLNSTKEI